MRFLRLLVLVLLIGASYFAQYLIDHRTLADLFLAVDFVMHGARRIIGIGCGFTQIVDLESSKYIFNETTVEKFVLC